MLWGTVFPILSKAIEDQTVTVGAPFFNKVMTPIGLLLLFLTGAGPLLAWRKTSFQSIRRNFTLPLSVASVGSAILFALGVRQLYAWMTAFLCIFVTVCILAEFYKGARTRQRTLSENLAQAVYNLTLRNTRRYGGYIIHLGIVLLFAGFIGQAFKSETKGLMQEGDLLRAKGYLLRCESLAAGENPNYAWQRATFSVVKDGRALGTIDPERRLFKASQEVTSRVAIRSTLAEDLYVVLAGDDQESGKAIIQVFINPLVAWVWIGGVVMLLGTLLALVPSRVEREMAQIRQAPEEALAVEDETYGT